MSTHRLPDGTTTTDYVSSFMAWAKFTAPLRERLGWSRLRSDHGCVFEIENGVTVSLPVSVVRQLSDIIAERDELMSIVHQLNDIVAERDELSRLMELSEAAIEDANRAVGREWLRPGVSLAKAITAKCQALEALNGGSK